MKLFRLLVIVLFTIATTCSVAAQSPWPDDEKDRDESVRKPVRRLHPEREREKAIKEYQKEQERLQRANGTWTDNEEETTPSRPKKDNRKVVGRVPHQQTSTSDKAALKEILSKDYSLVQIVPDAPQPYKWKDEPVDENESDLLRVLNRGNEGSAMRFMPRNVTMQNTDNAFFLYFDERSVPDPLRLRVQYCADDPLRFSRIDFVIDGFEYSYTPVQTKRGKISARLYWEMSDEPVKQADKDLIYALTHCNWAEMLLIGADGINHRKELNEDQLKALKATLQLYLLHGGTL
ncbi:MAG: hypothetical protein J5565_01390 [Muribaculaceae bacterium]|nr:hypothetical protein [Muribaculaceae bacterium]